MKNSSFQKLKRKRMKNKSGLKKQINRKLLSQFDFLMKDT